ncbi:hypothetical protein PCE1_004433 [Barthelona sp. PCE]
MELEANLVEGEAQTYQMEINVNDIHNLPFSAGKELYCTIQWNFPFQTEAAQLTAVITEEGTVSFEEGLVLDMPFMYDIYNMILNEKFSYKLIFTEKKKKKETRRIELYVSEEHSMEGFLQDEKLDFSVNHHLASEDFEEELAAEEIPEQELFISFGVKVNNYPKHLKNSEEFFILTLTPGALSIPVYDGEHGADFVYKLSFELPEMTYPCFLTGKLDENTGQIEFSEKQFLLLENVRDILVEKKGFQLHFNLNRNLEDSMDSYGLFFNSIECTVALQNLLRPGIEDKQFVVPITQGESFYTALQELESENEPPSSAAGKKGKGSKKALKSVKSSRRVKDGQDQEIMAQYKAFWVSSEEDDKKPTWSVDVRFSPSLVAARRIDSLDISVDDILPKKTDKNESCVTDIVLEEFNDEIATIVTALKQEFALLSLEDQKDYDSAKRKLFLNLNTNGSFATMRASMKVKLLRLCQALQLDVKDVHGVFTSVHSMIVEKMNLMLLEDVKINNQQELDLSADMWNLKVFYYLCEREKFDELVLKLLTRQSSNISVGTEILSLLLQDLEIDKVHELLHDMLADAGNSGELTLLYGLVLLTQHKLDEADVVLDSIKDTLNEDLYIALCYLIELKRKNNRGAADYKKQYAADKNILLFLGDFLLEKHFLQLAEFCFIEYLNMYGAEAGVYLRFAKIHVITKSFETAQRYINEVILLDSGDLAIEIRLLQGQLLYYQGDYVQSEQHFLHAFKILNTDEKFDDRSIILFAFVLIKQSNFSALKSFLLENLNDDNRTDLRQCFYIWQALGVAYLHFGDLITAENCLNQANMLNPEQVDVLLNVVILLQKRILITSSGTHEEEDVTITQRKEKLLNEINVLLTESLSKKEHLSDFSLLLLIAQNFSSLKLFNLAATVYRSYIVLIERKGDSVDIIVQRCLADALYFSRRHEEARTIYESILPIVEDDKRMLSSVLKPLINICKSLGDPIHKEYKNLLDETVSTVNTTTFSDL